MTSRARELAAFFSPSKDAGGEISIGAGGGAGVTVVATVNDLPGSATEGEQYFVQSDGYIYLWSGTEWDQLEKTSRSIGTSILFSGD